MFRGQEYQKAVTLEVMGLCRIIFNNVRKLYKMLYPNSKFLFYR